MSSVASSKSSYVFPFWRCLSVTAAMSLSYLGVSMALPVISIFVSHNLGYDHALGGLAVGISFLTTVLTRNWAGNIADTRGAKKVIMAGLITYCLASLVCLVSARSGFSHHVALLILLFGRLLLGLGESLTLVGSLTLGLGFAEREGAGAFMAMHGAGMYGSFAVGGPLGLIAYNAWGFAGLMLTCAAAPLFGLFCVSFIPPVAPSGGKRNGGFMTVLRYVWEHGLIVGLQGVGFAAIGAFEALLFKSRGWDHPGAGLALFAIGFVVMRFIGPLMLRRISGRALVRISFCIEIVGQAMLWLSPEPHIAMVGSFLTGMGCSMIYPAIGADIVGFVPSNLRGTAMGVFSAFQDVAYGVTGPLAGLAADRFGQPVVFLIGMLAAILGLILIIRMKVRKAA